MPGSANSGAGVPIGRPIPVGRMLRGAGAAGRTFGAGAVFTLMRPERVLPGSGRSGADCSRLRAGARCDSLTSRGSIVALSASACWLSRSARKKRTHATHAATINTLRSMPSAIERWAQRDGPAWSRPLESSQPAAAASIPSRIRVGQPTGAECNWPKQRQSGRRPALG
jgi:hypothetical protein